MAAAVAAAAAAAAGVSGAPARPPYSATCITMASDLQHSGPTGVFGPPTATRGRCFRGAWRAKAESLDAWPTQAARWATQPFRAARRGFNQSPRILSLEEPRLAEMQRRSRCGIWFGGKATIDDKRSPRLSGLAKQGRGPRHLGPETAFVFVLCDFVLCVCVFRVHQRCTARGNPSPAGLCGSQRARLQPPSFAPGAAHRLLLRSRAAAARAVRLLGA